MCLFTREQALLASRRISAEADRFGHAPNRSRIRQSLDRDPPAWENDGEGTFTAAIGGDAAHGQPGYARWNFDFYAKQTGGNYVYNLLYDLDPAAGTQEAALGNVTFPISGGITAQNSWNLGFGFLGTDAPGVTAPDYTSTFAPGAIGEYSFALIARDVTNTYEIGRSAILVKNTVPEPASRVLLGTGLAALAVARRRKKAQQVQGSRSY